MNDLQFGKPGNTYKKVKAVKLDLANKDGQNVQTEVSIYLYSGGTPHFAVLIPKEWNDFFTVHESAHKERINLTGGVVSSADFAGVEKALERISYLYGVFVKQRSLKKVIVYALTIKTPQVVLEKLSFSDSYSHVVGISASVRYLVNGKFYSVSGMTSDQMAAQQELPAWDSLHCTGSTRVTSYVPFSDEAWATFCSVKQTLQRAAEALHRLKDPAQAELLLAAGAQALLSAPEAA